MAHEAGVCVVRALVRGRVWDWSCEATRPGVIVLVNNVIAEVHFTDTSQKEESNHVRAAAKWEACVCVFVPAFVPLLALVCVCV